jgi:hypothetical protein
MKSRSSSFFDQALSFFSTAKPARLVVAETKHSVWSYHLRAVVPGDEKFGGGAGPAVCGSELGWDTKIPISSYGLKAKHIPEKYCTRCAEVAISEKICGYDDLSVRAPAS